MKVKRNTKENGSGGRWRVALFVASVTALLLVPAAMASAAVDTHIIMEGTGSGTVFSAEPQEGTPPLNCHYTSPGPSTGTCDTESQESEGFKGINAKYEAAPGSKFVGWKVESGTVLFPIQCKQIPNPPTENCVVQTFGEEIKIKAIFEKLPNVHIAIGGEGSGSVVGTGTLKGIPSVNCHWNGETKVLSGDCNVVASKAGGITGINVKYEVNPGFEFAGWTHSAGTFPEGSCEPLAEICAGTLFGGATEIKIQATFNKIVPKFKLNTSTSGTGSGSLKCDSGSGEETCKAEYPEGSVVKVLPKAGAGSEFGGFSGDCSGLSCELTMNAEHSVNAAFSLESKPFSVSQTGEGTVQCKDVTAGGALGACATSYPFGHTIKVAVAPIGENVIGSLTGSGSAAGKCAFEATSGSCEFSITEASGVSVTFVAGNTIATQKENVHGEVPQTTELATSCAGDVDLGEFLPGKAASYVQTCALTVTSTGQASSLTAADETGNDTGHLTQKPTHPYSLPSALETKATGLPGLEFPGTGGGTYGPLTSPVTLLSYGGPVSADDVTLSFQQKIGAHDALHTGVYAKMITLTLKQTTP